MEKHFMNDQAPNGGHQARAVGKPVMLGLGKMFGQARRSGHGARRLHAGLGRYFPLT